ncbi:MAG: class I SAM-dependent methyltransferase [Acidobacteria bacterium]|nr:class I SAM-dependent methyltransferase [Acidobacteriota bacterium]
MEIVRFTDFLLEQTIVYSLWQAPFAADKFAPIATNNDLSKVKRVLDVGCGPGTNTRYFDHADYLGVEVNPKYVAEARRKFNREFVVADVTTYERDRDGGFDFVLVNSFLHHINLEETHRVLDRLRTWVSPDGYIHIIELTSPGDRSIAQLLADWDRGKFARPAHEWKDIFAQHMDIKIYQPFPVCVWGNPLWQLVYCKGSA